MSHNTQASVGQNQGRLSYAHNEEWNSNCFGPPPSALHPPRHGISLTEVLIAMGILTVGLLGVASIFPVASFYMQKGDVADRGSAIAQAAFNDALARGMFNPENWLMLEDATGVNNGSFTKQFAARLRGGLAAMVTSSAAALQKQQLMNREFGTAYVIDPLGVDGSPFDATDPDNRRQARFVQTLPYGAVVKYGTFQPWWPWNPTTAPAAAINTPKWPVVRVTLPQPSTNPATRPIWPMTTTVADRLFRSSDDLAIEVPAQADRPSAQLIQTMVDGSNKVPLARQSRGDYSWMATVVPSSVEARNALATDPSMYNYEVSVAVFHKRVIDNLTTDSAPMERLTVAKVVSTGLSGGEMLITGESTDPDQFASLKTGNWVLICGPSPNSASDRPMFVARWYRVLSITDQASNIVTDAQTQRLVALRGPNWPWQPAANLTASELSNSLCCVIVPNVVAVHSKTIQLSNNSAWSIQ